MTSETLSPPKEASKLSHILTAYAAQAGENRFPVDVERLARGCADFYQWKDPIADVQAADIQQFEGGLFKVDSEWLLLYNSSLSSKGRVRFTQAHELGHYILHRSAKDSFQCTEQDMLNWSKDEQDIEAQADQFASYLLMPLTDFRQQVGQTVDLDVLSHCAARYGVSLTAAVLKWLDYTEEKAVVLLSSDGFVHWASSSEPAFRAGAFFRTRGTPMAVPAGSITADQSALHVRDGRLLSACTWFDHAEPSMSVREMKITSTTHNRVLTLLVLPRLADVWPPRAG